MTTAQYIAQMKAKLGDFKAGQQFAIACNNAHVEMSNRIFIQGKMASGSDIGSTKSNGGTGYDDSKELYVNPNNAPRNFPTTGKNGSDTFQNSNKHKTGYFKSYKDFRSTVGRKVDKVNLNLFGNLKSDFSKPLNQISNFRYVSTVRTENENKIEGNEKRFGSIFAHTKGEKENLFEDLKQMALEVLS